MPMMLLAPLMSALAVTLRVAGSMVTMDLPSTRPMIQPASAETVKHDAASAPSRAVVVNLRCMESLPVESLATMPGSVAPGGDGQSYGRPGAGLHVAAPECAAEHHVFVRPAAAPAGEADIVRSVRAIGADNADAQGCCPAAHVLRRERPFRAPAVVRSDRHEGARDAPGGSYGAARADGLWPFEPAAHGKDPSPVLRPAHRGRDRRHRSQDQRVPARARWHADERPGDAGKGAGAAVRERRREGARQPRLRSRHGGGRRAAAPATCRQSGGSTPSFWPMRRATWARAAASCAPRARTAATISAGTAAGDPRNGGSGSDWIRSWVSAGSVSPSSVAG